MNKEIIGMKHVGVRFFLYFISFGLLVSSFGTAMMYMRYIRYVTQSYETTLAQVTDMVGKRCQDTLKDPDGIVRAAYDGTAEYWDTIYEMASITESFGLAYIYYVHKTDQGFEFVLSSEYTPDMPIEEIIEIYEDIPDDMIESYDAMKVVVSEPYTDEYGTFISVFRPVFSGDGSIVGTLGADCDISTVALLKRRAHEAFLVSILLALAVGGALAFAVARSLVMPIKEVETAARSLAKMDFTITIKKMRRDEIGDIQRALFSIRDNLKKKVGDLNNELVGKQLNISANLRNSIKTSSNSLAVITDSMSHVIDQAKSQMDSVAHTAAAVEDIVKHSNHLESVVQTQSLNIAKSSEAVEQMARGVTSVGDIVHNAHNATETLGKSSEASKKMLDGLLEELSLISARSEFLEEANATLGNIAAQTNILAMNAAIESAHAGESGKGFGVVAGEIRKLAVSSNKESASISDEIKKMRSGIENIWKASAETANTMNIMFSKVTDMGMAFERVSGAVESQMANREEVMSALEALKETSDSVHNASSEIHKRSAVIYEAVESLKGMSRQVTESMLDAQKIGQGIAVSLDIAQKIADGRYLLPPKRASNSDERLAADA
ncbi:MAG: methyl-accepting chemotaxis protein [Treponema sp.]|jgi:methyl-accepting chemotaxis protein|nr:methyl-accepting chemotaxis protein [Treponema sp.]